MSEAFYQAQGTKKCRRQRNGTANHHACQVGGSFVIVAHAQGFVQLHEGYLDPQPPAPPKKDDSPHRDLVTPLGPPSRTPGRRTYIYDFHQKKKKIRESLKARVGHALRCNEIIAYFSARCARPTPSNSCHSREAVGMRNAVPVS